LEHRDQVCFDLIQYTSWAQWGRRELEGSSFLLHIVRYLLVDHSYIMEEAALEWVSELLPLAVLKSLLASHLSRTLKRNSLPVGEWLR
jgi:hypothetical protein